VRRFPPSRILAIVVATAAAGLLVWRLWPGPEPAADRRAVVDDNPGTDSDAHERFAPGTTRSQEADPAGRVRIAPPERSGLAGPAALVLPPGPYRRPSPDDCDDGNPCTRRDRVVDGECRGQAFTCDDGNPLTTDECTGQGCLFRPAPGVTRPALE